MSSFRCRCLAFLTLCLGVAAAQIPAEDIRLISDQIWQGDFNRITGNDVQYSSASAPLFTFVNEARFNGPTYAPFIALMNNYNPQIGQPETCDVTCVGEENAFLDALLTTRPIQLLHNWLFFRGLAPQSLVGFKEQIRQYFFTRYSRSAGPLDSSGFEHVFMGETSGGDATGFHNWVVAYFREKSGDFVYGPYLNTCPNELLSFSFNFHGAYKPISSMFMRTSPEVEIALYTLCFTVLSGTDCPVRRNGADFSMTTWERDGIVPRTIETAYPNC